MSNEVANRGSNALSSLAGLKKNLQNVATSIVTPGGDYLLRLIPGGWVYGAENIEVEDKSEWAVNPLSLMHGWAAWTDYKKKKNELLGEVMVPAGQPLPNASELREIKDDDGNVVEWKQQLAFQLQCMSGEDKGEQVRYKATSVGGMNATKELLNAIVDQLDNDPDNPVSVLTLETDSYIHKIWGKTMVPVFTIVDWLPLDAAIKAPLPDTEEPDADIKAPEAEKPAEATRQRTRQAAPDAGKPDATVAISAEDRRKAIDANMAELAQERAASRQAQTAAADEGPARRRRR